MFRHVAITVTVALFVSACEQPFDHADPSRPRPTVPDRVELDELADDEETGGEETGDAGEGTRPMIEGCCTCVDGLPVCSLWSSEPPLLGQATCAGTFVDSCDIVEVELLCPVDC